MTPGRKTAWITGASSGIGEALTREYAGRGWSLCLLARREEVLAGLCRTLQSEYPRQFFHWEAVDISEEQDLLQALDRLVRKGGLPDLLIANAGVGRSVDPLLPGWENTRRTLLTNVLGTLAGMEFCKELWVRSRTPGQIAVISSVAGVRGLPGTAAYSASKAALATYAESCRPRWEEAGIRISCIFPGYVRTPMTARNPWMPWLLDPEQAAARIAGAIERGKKRYVFPFPMRIVFGLLRHMPDPVFDWLSRKAGTAAMRRKAAADNITGAP